MTLRLRDVTDEDLPLISQWLHADHVREDWGDPDANLLLLSEPPADGAWRAILEAEGRAVGMVLWQHPSREELDMAGLTDIPTSVIDIDIMTPAATLHSPTRSGARRTRPRGQGQLRSGLSDHGIAGRRCGSNTGLRIRTRRTLHAA